MNRTGLENEIVRKHFHNYERFIERSDEISFQADGEMRHHLGIPTISGASKSCFYHGREFAEYQSDLKNARSERISKQSANLTE